MKITFNEAQRLGIWATICTLGGINEWAVNEGLLDPNKELEIKLPPQRRFNE